MKDKGKTMIILILLCIIIAIVPLAIVDSEFTGADDLAAAAIEERIPDYEPWAAPLYEPPGGETESLLFCLQAALGAAVIGYGFGTLKERSKYRNAEVQTDAPY